MRRGILAGLVACGAPSAQEPADPAGVAAPEAAPESAADQVEPAPPPAPRFEATVSELPAALRQAMIGTSWREGCPTSLDELRVIRLNHWDFEGSVAAGSVVVHREAVPVVQAAFAAAFAERFPIRRVEPVSSFGGSDDASMAADNTSAFNCRRIKGTSTWSEHSSGMAIDVNPRENPWVRGKVVDPPEGRDFLTRDPAVPGLLTADSAMVKAFEEAGWGWGGRWSSRKDYQHFSASGK